MSVVLYTAFGKVTHDIKFQPQTEIKGKKLVLAGHVTKVEEYREDGVSFLIQAEVVRQTTVSNKSYITQLNVSFSFLME